MAKIGVIGAGSWGTALSRLLANNGHDVIVWSIIEAEVKMLQEKHEHVDKLPGVKLPESMEFTTDLKKAIEGKVSACTGCPFFLYKKYGKVHARVCGRRADHCQCSKGN